MLLATLMYIGLALLVAKSLWNIAVPYLGHRRYSRISECKDTSVSLYILLDAILVSWTTISVALTDDPYLFWHRAAMIALCLLLPIASYLGLTAFGMILRTLYKKRYEQPRQAAGSDADK